MRSTLISIGCLLLLAGLFAYSYLHQPTPTTEELMFERTPNASTTPPIPIMTFSLISPAFPPNETIPSLYTCDGENIPPPLLIKAVPEGTVSFALVMDDPDIPQEVKDTRGIEKFDHWAMYNIPPETTEINKDTVADYGNNGAGAAAYTGPCPPPQYEPAEHRYLFRLYALSDTLHFDDTPTLDEIEAAATEIMIGKAEYIGRYQRVEQ